MPYIWNPTQKRTEWKQWWGGQDYGPEPNDQFRDTNPDPNAPLPPENPKDEEGHGITPPWDWDQPDFASPGSNPANLPNPPTTNYSQWGTNRYEGWDQSKIAANSTSPKYQVGRVLSNFDPRAGITPAVLAELNKLGIGTFEGSGQNLRVVNASPEFEGYTDWGDMIHGWQGGAGADAAWQYGINNSRDTGGGFAGTTFPPPTYTGAGQGQTAGQKAALTGDPSENPFASHPAGGVWVPSLGQWVPGDHPLAQTPGAIPGGTKTSISTSSSSSTPATIQDEARAAMLELLRTPRTVDPEALRHSPEMQAVQLQAQRAEERDRAALAERAAEGGWSGSGGFEGGLTALREGRGETEMQFMGQLAITQMERNREDIKAGIEFALNQGQFDEAQALKRELAALDAAIEREKIAANVDMNDAEIEVRKLLGLGDLDLRKYLGQIGSAYDFANLQYIANRDAYDRIDQDA